MATGASNQQYHILLGALDRESRNLQGQKKLEASLANKQGELLKTVNEEIQETLTRIEFLESQLEALSGETGSVYTNHNGHATLTVGFEPTSTVMHHNMHESTPMRPFEYLKHESPLTPHKVAFKLQEIKRKLATEKKLKHKAEQATRQLKQELGTDPIKIADAQLAELEANARVACLMKAELRWQQLYIPSSPNQNTLEEIGNFKNTRQSKNLLSGTLKIRIITAANLPNKSPDSASYAVIRVDGIERARTKPSSTSWNQDFDIEISKAEETEMAVYSDDGLLLSLICFKISELSQAISAEDPHHEGIGSWFGFGKHGGLQAWLDLDPAGQVLARFQFVEDKYDIQPESAFLKRRQAVKKNGAVRGHRFQKAPRGISNRCVVCDKIMLTGLACEYCKYSVHKECSEKSLTCLVNPEVEEQESEDDKKVAKHLSKHRILHRFSAVSAPIAPPCWCKQCGQVVPPLTYMRKCSGCDHFSVHTACEKLVPHFCGMSAQKADEFMKEAEKIEEKKRREVLELEETKRLQVAEEARKSTVLERYGYEGPGGLAAPSHDELSSPGIVNGTSTSNMMQAANIDIMVTNENDVYQKASQALEQRRKEREEFESRMQQYNSFCQPKSPLSNISPLNMSHSLLYEQVSQALADREREKKYFESRRASMVPPEALPLAPPDIPKNLERKPSAGSTSSIIPQSKSPLMANAPPRTVSLQFSEIPAFPPSPVYSGFPLNTNDPNLIKEKQAALEAFKRSRGSTLLQQPQASFSTSSVSSIGHGPPRTASLIDSRSFSSAQSGTGLVTPGLIEAFMAEQQRLYAQAQQNQQGRPITIETLYPGPFSTDAINQESNAVATHSSSTMDEDQLLQLSQEPLDYYDLDELLREEEEEDIRLREQEERRRRDELERQAMAKELERRAREQEDAARRSLLQETAQQRIRELVLAQQLASQQCIQMETRLREAATRREQDARMREELHQRELQQAALAIAQKEALKEQQRRDEYERQLRAQQLHEQLMRQQEYLSTVKRNQQVLCNQQLLAMEEHRQQQQQLYGQQEEHMRKVQVAHSVAVLQKQQVTAAQHRLQTLPRQQSMLQHSETTMGRRAMSVKKNVSLNDFSLIAVLGKGAFGKVLLVEDQRTKELFALKSLKKDHAIENNDIESIKSELLVFRLASTSKFPFLVNLYACFQTAGRLNFVMEYAAGGDLMLHLSRSGRFPRNTEGIKYYAAELLLALEFLHQHNVVYRDLKPENVLLSPEGHIKLADYGVCKENVGYGVTTRTFCGTLDTMAPEIIKGEKYTRAVDWWSYGIMLYVFVYRSYPYKGNNETDYLKEITSKSLRFPVDPDPELKDLILKLLVVNPNRRLGSGKRDADEIKMHQWFYGVDWEALLNLRIPPPFVPPRKNAYDISNFDVEFTRESPAFTQIRGKLSNKDQNEFVGFDFISTDWGTSVAQHMLAHSVSTLRY